MIHAEAHDNLRTVAKMFLEGSINGIELANLADEFRRVNAEFESRDSNRQAAHRARASRRRLPQFTMALPKPTLHTCNDGEGPDFDRLTQGCSRCDELRTGAPARSGRNARRF